MPDIGHLLTGIGAVALVWLPLVMVGMIIYLLWRTVQVMPRIQTKSATPTSKSSVSWDEVAGLEEARDEMEEIVDVLRDSKRVAKLGARVP
jgi:cell division protease FtsH